ncbi:hypothetical protein Ddc_14999 [Ditylenchus destructor]|nr:hypothetical protein Ddc_14999 [Ditylenchus destructor]
MPCPDQFVRFEKVTIHRYLEEDEIKFLLKSRESFVECELELSLTTSSEVAKSDQIRYVLQNVFHRPSWVEGNYDIINCKLLETNALLNCNKLEVYPGRTWSEETISLLLDWLKCFGNLKSVSDEGTAKKHLILSRYPLQRIIPMIHRLKKEFETLAWPSMEFVITFLICPSDYTNNQNLEGHEFSMDTNGTRLSLFQHDEYGTVYRLWYRRVLNEANDNAMLSHILNIPNESAKRHSKRQRHFETKYELYSFDGLVFYG